MIPSQSHGKHCKCCLRGSVTELKWYASDTFAQRLESECLAWNGGQQACRTDQATLICEDRAHARGSSTSSNPSFRRTPSPSSADYGTVGIREGWVPHPVLECSSSNKIQVESDAALVGQGESYDTVSAKKDRKGYDLRRDA